MTIKTLSNILAGAALAAFVSLGAATAHAADTATVSAPAADASHTLWSHWAALWNGDYSQQSIIAPDFRLHAVLLDGRPDTAIAGREAFIAWIKQARAPFQAMQFTGMVGPLADGDYVAGRWRVTGVYRGGMPGAKVAPGTAVTFDGTDILRVRGGQIVEYWLSSDTLSLLAQLKVSSGG